MGKARLVYELSFFVVLIFVLVNKFANNAALAKGFLIATGVAAVYEILYILVLHKRDLISMGRTIAVAGVWLSVDLIVIIAIFAVTVLMRDTNNIATIFSSIQLSEFYGIPAFVNIPAGNLIVLVVCLIYLIAFKIITKKIDYKISF